MHLLAVACAALLSVAFLVAAAMKVIDYAGVLGSSRALGVPGRWAPATARALPVIEVTLAAGLLFHRTARPAGATAVALLGVFTAVVAWNLQRGNRPACNCFGAATSRPIGRETVLRNLMLMALALVVLLMKDPAVVPGVRSLIDQHNRLGSVVAVLIVAVATQSALVFLALTGRHRGPSPVTVGQAAPSFRLPDLRHHTVASEDLLARGRPLLVLFVDPGCSPCHALQPEVAGWMSDLSGALEVVAVTTGSHDRNHDRFDLLDPSRVLVQKTDEVASRFGFGGTPSAIVIAADGTLDSEIALGGREIRRLVGRTLPTGFVAAPARPIDPGDRAPAFRLMTGSGDEIDLVSDGDRPQLVLFWDREGGDRAHEPVLLELEQRLVRGGLKVIIVTSGRSQSGLGLFRSPVALDPDRLVQTAFGVTELPGAALVGRGGVLASHVAIGLAEVTALVAAADATAQVAERLADTTTG